MGIDQMIVAQNRYVLTGPAEAFVTAVKALAARVNHEGHPGVLSYRFFTGGQTGVADVIYADADAWIGHHDCAMEWPEMAALRRAARLEHVTLCGPVTQAILEWCRDHGLTMPMTLATTFAGGFDRRET
jgi:hypothetical protein